MNTPKKSHAPLVISLCIIACLIWGAPFKLLKLFYEELQISAETFGDNYNGQMLLAVSLRFFIAGIFTLLFAQCTHNHVFRLRPIQWGKVALMGLISTTTSYYFFNIGNVNISSSANASLLGQSGIFFGVILAPFVYKNEKFTLQKVLALLLGFAGLLLSQIEPGRSFSQSFSAVTLQGEGFMLLHGVIFAIATIMGKKFMQDLNSFVMTGWNLVIGSTLLGVLGILMGGRVQALTFTPKATFLLFLLAAASAIPFSIWYWCTQYMEISKLSMFKFLIPVSGSLIAVAFGEPFTWVLGIGLAMVCAAIILINVPFTTETKERS